MSRENIITDFFKPIESTRVSNIVHFIWAGGKKIPDKEFDNLLTWKEKCTHHKIILWIDRKTSSNDDIQEMEKRAKEAAIELLDIEENGLVTPQIRHALNSVDPNYGKSSDLLRYAILSKFGGIYLDCDIICARPFPQNIFAPRGFMMCPWSQGRNFSLSNDILFAAPGSKLMYKIHELAQASYLNILTDEDHRDNYTLYDALTKKGTIRITGPEFLSNALHQLGMMPNKDDGKDDNSKKFNLKVLATAGLLYGMTVDTIDKEYENNNYKYSDNYCEFQVPSPRERNYSSWLEAKDTFFAGWSYEKQLAHIVNLIVFEVECMHALLLTKYMDYFESGSLKGLVSMEKFASDLAKKLTDLCSEKKGFMHNLKHVEFDCGLARYQSISDFFKNNVSLAKSAHWYEHIDKVFRSLVYCTESDIKTTMPAFKEYIYFMLDQCCPWDNPEKENFMKGLLPKLDEAFQNFSLDTVRELYRYIEKLKEQLDITIESTTPQAEFINSASK